MPELRVANDLNNMVPLPLSELLAAKPPPTELVKCVPAGAESDMNSSVMDLGDELDKTETVGPSRSSTPTMKIGPTWAEVHTAAQEEEMAKRQAPSWEDIINTTPAEEGENWATVDSQSTMEDQSDDVIVEDEIIIQTVMEAEELDHAVVGEPLTQWGEADKDDVDQKYMPTPAGEVPL